MSEWWTYSLSDLVMYSRQTYYRLFELYNVAIWPAQIFAVAAGVSAWALLRRADARRGRLIAAFLAVCWLWVAIAFHAKRYAAINWAAVDFAWGFGVEAVLLVWAGVVRGRLVFGREVRPMARVGLAIFLFALAVQPMVGLVFGRTWRQLEFFGLAPDPTAIGTLGILLLAAGRTRWELIVIPAIWCVISAAMLWAMKTPDAWIVAIAALFVTVLVIARAVALRRQPPRREAISEI
jgi:hypothetical protein